MLHHLSHNFHFEITFVPLLCPLKCSPELLCFRPLLLWSFLKKERERKKKKPADAYSTWCSTRRPNGSLHRKNYNASRAICAQLIAMGALLYITVIWQIAHCAQQVASVDDDCILLSKSALQVPFIECPVQEISTPSTPPITSSSLWLLGSESETHS